MLNSDDDQIREKAAWEMTRLPEEVAGPLLVENLSTTDLNAREILEFGLYDFPQKAAIDKIEALLEKESGKSGDKFDRDRTRLRMLRAYLKNHAS
jgi:HEAT repeat protein